MSIEPHNTISVELPNDAATETKQDAGNTLLDAISDTLIAEAEAAPRTAFGEQSHAPPDWPLVEESRQPANSGCDIVV